MINLLFALNLLLSPQPGGQILMKPEIITWGDKSSPNEVMTSATPISDYGQVTSNGHIILATHDELFDYRVDGSFVRSIRMQEDQKIRAHVFDSDRHLYMVNYFDNNADPSQTNSFFKFYRANGTEVKQDPIQFVINNEVMVVNQMQYLGEDLFLFNVWAKSFNQLGSPRTMVIAKRSVSKQGFQLEAVGTPFDDQYGRKRQFQDNFVDRWAVFFNHGGQKLCVVAHTMVPELQFYQVKNEYSKAEDRFHYSFQKDAPTQPVTLPNWQDHREYPMDLKERSQKKGLSWDRSQLLRAWFFHFSRLRGLYKISADEMVLGYVTPNPMHPFYAHLEGSPQQDNASTTHVLNLLPLRLNQSESGLHAKQLSQPISVEGGIFLGTYKQSAFVLSEQEVKTYADAPPNFSYTLHKINF